MKFLAVVVGLVLFAGLVVVGLEQNRCTRMIVCKSPPVEARVDVHTIKHAVLRFRDAHGHFPGQLDLLCQPEPGNPYAPFLCVDPGMVRDPWGNAYVLEVDGDRFAVISYGADGVPGGGGEAADIVVEHP